ncbi:MAG: metalloregulator ArsR/SmtB family transcription factor [Halobacteriales archaeon]
MENAKCCRPDPPADGPPRNREIDPVEHVDLFKALANETRIAILAHLLAVEEACVCEIVPETGASQSTVSGHLSKLRDLDIVTSRREGRMVYYRIADPTAERVLRCLFEE